MEGISEDDLNCPFLNFFDCLLGGSTDNIDGQIFDSDGKHGIIEGIVSSMGEVEMRKGLMDINDDGASSNLRLNSGIILSLKTFDEVA
jgi:hypothetical protein